MLRSLILSFFIFFTATPILANTTNLCSTQHCLTIVDAGSTGSRIHLYAYELDETKTPVHIKELWSKKIKPGFASLEPKTETINNYLNLLFAEAPSKTPVYFYATAGMRLFPNARQKIYYQTLNAWFNQQDQWQLKEAKTLTGKEEALFDWLAVNDHLGTLKSKQTVGVVDIGGASVQVAFSLVNQEAANEDAAIELNLYGQKHKIFVHSALGLGQNEIPRQFLNEPSCFAQGYPLPDGGVGKGNAALCAQELNALIKGVHKVNQNVQPLLSANPVSDWYVLGGLGYLADDALHFEANQFTLQNLMQKGESELCAQSWDQLALQYASDEYAYTYCLLSAYYYALMAEGYGIGTEENMSYIPSKLSLDWTQGVVLYQGLENKT